MSASTWAIGLAAIGLSGCGEKGPTTPQATVSGSVTIDGKPIEVDSTVTFFSENEGANAGGVIDSMGNYNIKAGDPRIGIPVGLYKVSIRPPSPVTSTMGSASAEGGSSAETPDYMKMMGKPATPARANAKGAAAASKIPDEFQTLGTTPIVLELQSGPNKLDFDLAKLAKSKSKKK